MNKRLLLMSVILIFSTVCVLPVFENSLEDTQKQSQSITKQIGNVSQEKKQTEDKKNYLENAMTYYEMLENKQKKRYEMLLEGAQDVESLVQSIDIELNESVIRYEEALEIYKKRLRAMQENSIVTVLDTLFSSSSVVDFFERIQLMTTIAKNDKRLLDELKVLQKDVELKKSFKEDMASFLEQDAQAQQERVEEFRSSRSSVENQLRQTENELKLLERRLDELNAESNRLINEIKKLQSKRKYAGGIMQWPLPSAFNVGSAFGNRLHPILKVMKLHTGIDIGGTHSATIVAGNSGTVVVASWLSGYGNTIIIDHGGGISTLYAHCSALIAKVGQKVEKNQTIARVGSTGMSTGPHLHFEVRENGVPVNPLKGYLTQVR